MAGSDLTRLLEIDARLSNKMRIAERPGRLRTFAAFLAHSGDSWFWLLALAGLWLAGNDYWKSRAVSLAIGITLTAVIVLTIKFLVRRKRPEGDWGSIYRSTDPHSFPSGHAARAVMLAVLALALGPAWLAVVLILWAPFVSMARIAMGLHYLSDVLAGIVFGMIMGLVFGLALSHISHLFVVFSSIFCQLSWQGGFSYGVKVAIAHKTLILTPEGSPASTKSLFLVADLLRQSLHPLFW